VIGSVRVVVGLLGVAAAAYGAVELLDLGLDNLRAATTWLVAGVVLHDAVLAPVALGLWFVVSRGRRGRIPGAVVVGSIVLGTVTVVAVPLLGRFGARADNPTLLDRNYLLGWLVLATLTVVVVGVAVALSRTDGVPTGGGDDHGAGAGRR
jgi:hypothetical protein